MDRIVEIGQCQLPDCGPGFRGVLAAEGLAELGKIDDRSQHCASERGCARRGFLGRLLRSGPVGCRFGCIGGVFQGLANHRLEDIRLPHETEVAGVGGIGGAFGIVAVEVVAGDVVQILHALFLQRLVGRLEGGMVVGVVLVSRSG